MGKETLPLQIAQALLKPTFFLCVFFGFFAHLFVCFLVCIRACHHLVCLCTLQFIGDFLLLTIVLFCIVTLLTFFVALMNYSFHLVVVHHHLTIRHCLVLFIVTLCFSSLPCVAYHCIVVTIIALLSLSSPHYLSYQVLLLLLTLLFLIVTLLFVLLLIVVMVFPPCFQCANCS